MRVSYPVAPLPVTIIKTPQPPAVTLKPKSRGLLSVIEFNNSPYLNVRSYSENIVPVMVLSKASNIEVRDSIRRTWGFYRSYKNSTLRVKIFFIVGTDDFMTNRIHAEQIVFDDVIQVSLPDMYTFSAYKELAAMMWVRIYLPDLPFYIKTEDSVILNMKSFIYKLVPTIIPVINQELIIGWFGAEHHVQQGAYQKFVDAVMPGATNELDFAMSLFYIVTGAASDRMIEALSHVDLIEYPGDAFITGILRDAAHAKIYNIAKSSENFQYELSNGICKSSFQNNPNLLLCTTSLHVGRIRSMSEYFDAWNVLIGEKSE